MIDLILYVFAFVFFVLSAVNVPSRWNLIGAGLACVTLVQILGHWH